MKSTRESLCRICGDRLSFKGNDEEVHWKDGIVDDEDLVCGQCITIAKLEKMRKEIRKKDEEES